MSKFYVKILIVGSATALLFVGLIGFAHTKAGRPLLPYVMMAMGKPANCPLGFGKALTDTELRRIGSTYIVYHDQSAMVSEKPVPDFDFGKTTREQFTTFASGKSGSCHGGASANDIECLNVKTENGTENLWAMFNSQGRLADLKSIETIESAEVASSRYAQLANTVDERVGPPTSRRNAFTPTDLKSSLLYQAVREYYFRNYYSTLRVTNMGKNFAITSEFGDPEVFR